MTSIKHFAIAITAVATSFTTIEAAESKAYLHSYNLPASGLALEGYCPVACHTVSKPVKGRRDLAVRHDDVWYFFVSAEAKELFE